MRRETECVYGDRFHGRLHISTCKAESQLSLAELRDVNEAALLVHRLFPEPLRVPAPNGYQSNLVSVAVGPITLPTLGNTM